MPGGSIIGGALQAGASIANAIVGAQAAKKQKETIEKRQSDNQAWFDRKYNEDATQRADAQAMINRTQESVRANNRAAAAAQAVMGGTDESMASSRAANNQAMAQAASQIAIAGDARKDNIESTYMSRNDAFNAQLDDVERQRMENIQKATQDMAAAGGSIASSFGL